MVQEQDPALERDQALEQDLAQALDRAQDRAQEQAQAQVQALDPDEDRLQEQTPVMQKRSGVQPRGRRMGPEKLYLDSIRARASKA